MSIYSWQKAASGGFYFWYRNAFIRGFRFCIGGYSLDHKYPHISLKPQPWRSLKTTGSKRPISLVRPSLEAIKIVHHQSTTQFLFNTYTDATRCKGNSCSAALNKWLKQHSPKAVMHLFRHSFRDRLRNACVQSEMIDHLGGWSIQTVGQGYGDGFAMPILYNRTLSLEY